MTEEKPLSEQTGSNVVPHASNTGAESSAFSEQSTASENADIAAALSALSNAAAPARNEDAPADIPAPEDVTVSFASAPITDESASQVAPPPPPAPESVESYPAPTGAPIAVNTVPDIATSSSAVPPAPTAQRKKWPWILALCIIAGILLIGGIVSCTSAVMNVAFQSIQHNQHRFDDDLPFDYYHRDNDFWDYYNGMGGTFEDLLDMFDVEEGTVSLSGDHGAGAYRVGGDEGLEPGLYYLEGSQTGVSNFYIFHNEGTLDDDFYNMDASVEYFGNYYAELEDGDAIVFVPFSRNDTIHLAKSPMDVMPPYQSGCYRVGIDIPAGTYTITCDVEAARETDSEAGAYVMTDLDFDEDSIIESAYVIKGGRQTITVENGQYLELFAAIATPATASTVTPLQHVERGYHAA